MISTKAIAMWFWLELFSTLSSSQSPYVALSLVLCLEKKKDFYILSFSAERIACANWILNYISAQQKHMFTLKVATC